MAALKIAWQLGLWFHRTFGDPSFKSGPFIPPKPPKDESTELRQELLHLTQALREHEQRYHTAAEQLAMTEAQLRQSRDDQAFWEQMATEAEQAKTAIERKLIDAQAIASARPKTTVTAAIAAAKRAADAIQLDEADTRQLIDQQLQQAGWEADSQLYGMQRSPPRKGPESRHR